jgi:trimeric autotransporter adhesin
MKKMAIVVIVIMVVSTMCAGIAWAVHENDSNTWVGNSAGNDTMSGTLNSFFGWWAGHSNTLGQANIFIGGFAGYMNTEGTGNTFIGSSAGQANTTSSENTYIGTSAGYHSVGSGNILIGYQAGFDELLSDRLYISNSSTSTPLIYGEFDNQKVKINGTLETSGGIKFPDGKTQTTAAVTGSSITTLGSSAGSLGNNNSFIGTWAGHTNIDGHENTFVGGQSGNANDHGSENSFFGYSSGNFNKGGNRNTFIGIYSGYSNTSGSANTSLGYESGNTNSTGNYNTSIGAQAGNNNTGSNNVFLGYQTGYYNTGSNNIFIGYQSGLHANGSNKLYIDNCNLGSTNCDMPLIYGEFDTRNVNINGTLTMTAVLSPSDIRYKKNVEPLVSSLDKVMKLAGVSYEWKVDEHPGRGFDEGRALGLIAQDVEAVVPEVVRTDSKGYKSLAYDKLVPVLIEAIKEQQKIVDDQKMTLHDQKHMIDEQNTAIQRLTEKLAKIDRLETELNKFKSKDMTTQK